ncbi:MAG TPA: PAS domain-containing sensor histidine kinase, partial [Patescibacteria group bacterium]|nr:PAS domain-containing sensor histidine kinase [Patescibacteria group bacterium]
ECRYVYVNPTIEKVSGIPVSSFIGKTQKELSIPADQEAYWRTHIEAVFQTGMEKIIEFSFQTPTQGIRYFQARLVPEKAQNGAIQYVLAVAHDVTELKTHAEEVNHAKDQFISLVSHELRTPLTAIKGLISMMLHGDYGEISDRMRLPLTNVYTAALRQIHLINDLLSLSRLQTGRIHYTFSTFLPQTIVVQVISAYEPQAKVKRVELRSDPGEQIMVQADDLWVKEVLDNLVANAVKFTESGSIHVSYRYEADQVSIIVTDTGTGITPEQQQKLFGKFEQLITPEKGKAMGSGLGLYISRAVARHMGGDVFLEKSTQGQGSTFVFVLPKAGGQRAQLAKQELEKTQKLSLNKNGV